MPVASTNLTGFVAFFEFGRWEIAEGYVDVFFADDDLFGDAFDDSALFGWGEGGPAFVEVGCFLVITHIFFVVELAILI